MRNNFTPKYFSIVLSRIMATMVMSVTAGFLLYAAVNPAFADPADVTTVTLSNEVLVPNVKRLGINVGARDQWGAAQFIRNLIDNPGFEAGDYGMVAHAAAGSSGQRFEQDFWNTSWNNDLYNIGQPPGFWNGAEYEIVYGPAKGRTGTIISNTHENNHYTYYLDSDGTPPGQWDVMFLRKSWNGFYTANQWATADTGTIRPGSPGKQSLHMIYPDASWRSTYVFYMDSFWRDSDPTAGKLLLIEGNWRLEFWAKGNRPNAQLRVRFFREGEGSFIDQTVSLSTTWQQYVFTANVPPGVDNLGPYAPGAYHPILVFAYFLPNAGDEAWVDDMSLVRTDDTNPTVFVDAYVNRLKELRPGVLRDTVAAFGATLDQLLAEPWARGSQGYKPDYRIPNQFHYSLHEFLELCKEVGAEPWYMIPVTFSPQELSNLIDYLAAPAGSGNAYADRRAALGQTLPWTQVFPKIHLEFGNEAWGTASGSDPFKGASLLGGVRLGAIAGDRFGILRSNPHFNAANFDLVIGGQAGWPGQNYLIQSNSTTHDTIALAPYFGELDTYANDDEIFSPLFARPLDDVTTGRVKQCVDEIRRGGGLSTQLAVYEINFHTTYGSAPLDIRNDFVTGQGGAVALPLHMLTYMRDFQATTQMAFSSLQYSTKFSSSPPVDVRLWGMLRDLAATGRKRPTWLGVEATNHAIQGDMVRTTQSGSNPSWVQSAINGVSQPITVNYVQSFAFRNGDSYSAVLFNLNRNQLQRVSLALPDVPKSQATLYQVAPAGIHDDNEDSEQVTLQTQAIGNFASGYAMDLPPHSVTVLTWEKISGPDLLPTIYTATTSGSKLVSNNQIKNQGDTAAGRFDISYYLSVDNVHDGTDVFVCQEYLSSLAAGASSPPTGTWQSSCTVPGSASAPTGMYYAIVWADSGNAVVEGNEINNTLATAVPLGIGPDLTPTAMSAAKSGSTKVLVTDTVKNQGNRDAWGFTIRYYLSTNTTYEAGIDLALVTTANGNTPCNRTRSSLAVGASSSVNNKTCYKPSGAQNGVDYHVLVVDDVLGQVGEYDESNNAKSATGTLRW